MNTRLRDPALSKGAAARETRAGQACAAPPNLPHIAGIERGDFSADTLSVVLEGHPTHRYSVCMPKIASADSR